MNPVRLPGWHLGLLTVGLLVLGGSAVRAQPTPPQLRPASGDGTHLFRRILKDLDLEPIQTWSEFHDDPQGKILILLGDTRLLSGTNLIQLAKKGAAVLVASDRSTRSPSLEQLGLAISGRTPHVDADSPNAYREAKDCVLVRPTAQGEFLFRGLPHPVATNRAGYLFQQRVRTGEVPLHVWARFPEDTWVLVDGERQDLPSMPFAMGGDRGEGRILLLSDHSVFINAMLWQNDNGNLDFAYNCIEWLKQGKRTQVLLIDEGEVRTSFDVPLLELPPPPLPPPEYVVEAVDKAIAGLEEENRFNLLFLNALNDNRLGPEQAARGVLLLGTLALGAYGLSRLIQARHRFEPGVPALDLGLAQVLPHQITPLAQRQRDMLREDQYGELARYLVRQRLGAALGPTPPSARPVGKAMPRVEAAGSIVQQWSLRRKLARLWQIAYGDQVPRVTARQLRKLEAELGEILQAIGSGRLRMDQGTPPSPGAT